VPALCNPEAVSRPFIALTMRESQMKFGKRPAEKMRIWDRWKSSDPVELARAGRAGLGL